MGSETVVLMVYLLADRKGSEKETCLDAQKVACLGNQTVAAKDWRMVCGLAALTVAKKASS